MIETEKLKKQREARLAAEALFEPIAEPTQTAAATVVTVRHRRASQMPTDHVADASAGAPNEEAARPPRIHLLATEPVATTTDTAVASAPKVLPLDASASVADSISMPPGQAHAVDTEQVSAAVEVPAANAANAELAPTPPRQPRPRRTRRATTTAVAAEAQPVEKREVNTPPRTAARRRNPETKSLQTQALSAQRASETSGFDAYEWPVYPKLIAQIEDLKRKAQAMRERESAQAVQWIKEAIRQYGLSAQELGFGRSQL